MRRIAPAVRLLAPVLLVALGAVASTARPAAAVGTWTWPVVGPVIRGFDAPDTPYGSGHRGIDVAVPVGTVLVAPAAGVVSFAGPVGGRVYVTIDHGGDVRSTLSFLSATLVRRGDPVVAGQAVATSGDGHDGGSVPHLHLGVRLGDAYVDPLAYLSAPSVSGFVRLAPWDEPAA
ncbi:MAG TPA: M23 family metallopeptidase [Actinomycetota bacterium]